MSSLSLDEMRNVDIRTVNPQDLVDINDVRINPDKPKDDGLRDFIRQIRNPY